MSELTEIGIVIWCFLIICTIAVIAHTSAVRDEIIEEIEDLKEAKEEDDR